MLLHVFARFRSFYLVRQLVLTHTVLFFRVFICSTYSIAATDRLSLDSIHYDKKTYVGNDRCKKCIDYVHVAYRLSTE